MNENNPRGQVNNIDLEILAKSYWLGTETIVQVSDAKMQWPSIPWRVYFAWALTQLFSCVIDSLCLDLVLPLPIHQNIFYHNDLEFVSIRLCIPTYHYFGT